MAISAEEVRQLREKTGAGFKDCKLALEATNGDFDEAVSELRKKGIAVASKREGRAASQGLIVSYIHAGSQIGVHKRDEVHRAELPEPVEVLILAECRHGGIITRSGTGCGSWWITGRSIWIP